jgi:hypothetical protein
MKKGAILFIMLLVAGGSMVWAGIRFDHGAHLKEYVPGVTCDTCHLAGARRIVPDRQVCLSCHDQGLVNEASLSGTRTHGPVWALNHRLEAKSSAFDCAACHRQDYCLECHKSGFADEQGELGNNMINVHRSDFHVTHPIPARTDPQLCSSCHEPGFCSDCHNTFRRRIGRASGPSHRRTFDLGLTEDPREIQAIHAGFDETVNCDTCHLQGTVVPSFHEWSLGHAREARRNLMACQTCHADGDTCLVCHRARGGVVGFNPHGRNWKDRQKRLNNASNGKTCKKCH